MHNEVIKKEMQLTFHNHDIFAKALFLFMLALGVTLFYSITAHAGRFKLQEISVPGAVHEIVVDDLDGNGLQDVIAIFRKGEPGDFERHIAVFWQKEKNKFDQDLCFDLTLPRDVIMVDFGEVSETPGRELITATADRFYYYPLREGKYSGRAALLEATHIFMIPDSDSTPYYDFCFDWNGDGKDEIAVFHINGLKLYQRSADGLGFTANVIQIPVASNYNAGGTERQFHPHPNIRASYYIPRISLEDANADGRPDLFAANGDELHVFLQQADLVFSATPYRKQRFDLFTEEELRRSGDMRRQGPLNIRDFNRDGRADIIAVKHEGRGLNRNDSVLIYWGDSKNPDEAEPDQTLAFEHAVVGPYFHDMNRDGKLDMVVPVIDINIFSAARTLITGGFPVEWYYYILQEDGRFPDKPSYTDETSLNFDMGSFRLLGGFPNILADFNGDGYSDIVYGKSEDELVVEIKDKNGGRSGTKEVINVPTCILPVVHDLDGNGKSDIILYYPDEPERSGEIRILTNEGPW